MLPYSISPILYRHNCPILNMTITSLCNKCQRFPYSISPILYRHNCPILNMTITSLCNKCPRFPYSISPILYRHNCPILNMTLTKKVREKSRECHNHKPQPYQDTKRNRKQTNQTSANRTNVQKAIR